MPETVAGTGEGRPGSPEPGGSPGTRHLDDSAGSPGRVDSPIDQYYIEQGFSWCCCCLPMYHL